MKILELQQTVIFSRVPQIINILVSLQGEKKNGVDIHYALTMVPEDVVSVKHPEVTALPTDGNVFLPHRMLRRSRADLNCFTGRAASLPAHDGRSLVAGLGHIQRWTATRSSISVWFLEEKDVKKIIVKVKKL